VTEVAGPAAAARAAVGTEAEAKAAEAWVEAERVVVARAAVATVAESKEEAMEVEAQEAAAAWAEAVKVAARMSVALGEGGGGRWDWR
jgi:hypothetical protein